VDIDKTSSYLHNRKTRDGAKEGEMDKVYKKLYVYDLRCQNHR
jgi:hypothetical protein